MFQRFFKDRLLVILVVMVVLIKLFALNENWVEHYYTNGLYPVVSSILRVSFGWVPFSIGDVLYMVAIFYFLIKVVKLVVLIRKKELKKHLSAAFFLKYLKIIMAVYVIFYLFWGLNYNRQGIAQQLGLKVRLYSKEELVELTCVLQDRLNFYAVREDSLQRKRLDKNSVLFSEALDVYQHTVRQYSFLNYRFSSQKPSMYSSIGQYIGFTGYYNPFTGEAQVKTSVPVFTKPFIICHEIGHQLGYAKENEANFVSYLACKSSNNVDFLYSVYFDMYRYALNDLMRRDFYQAYAISKGIHQRVKNDFKTLRAYFQRTQNPIEPLANKFYDQYLKLNNQPKGFQTYNEVVAWLVAYKQKFGKESL